MEKQPGLGKKVTEKQIELVYNNDGLIFELNKKFSENFTKKIKNGPFDQSFIDGFLWKLLRFD